MYKLQKRFQAAFGFTLRASPALPAAPLPELIALSHSHLLRPGTLQLCVPLHRCWYPALTRFPRADNVGVLPYRHPIVSVVGRPIRVTQVDNPTMAQMEEVQAQYIVELKR